MSSLSELKGLVESKAGSNERTVRQLQQNIALLRQQILSSASTSRHDEISRQQKVVFVHRLVEGLSFMSF
jgi:hypothetical protein